MKKIMMMAAMAAFTATAFAQTEVIKQAQKEFQKGDRDQALKTLQPALTAGTDAEKAAAWNAMAEIQYDIYMEGSQIETENQIKQTTVEFDTAAMHKGAYEAFKAVFKCDEYDKQPNEKGKVKPKYRATNGANYAQRRGVLINAGLYEYNKGNRQKAVEIWSLYIDSRDNELFTGIDLSVDPSRSEIAYYASLTAYQMQDYATAVKYAKVAAEDPEKEKDANEILLFSQKENCKNAADSLEYLATIKELHKQYPDEERYFNMISEYYAAPQYKEEMMAWCNEEIALNPNNKMPYALKGEVYMNEQKWDEAVEAYKKSVEVDPEFVPVLFNIGICLNSKAIAINDASADASGRLSNADYDKVKSILTESKSYLEKAKALDPYREKANWAYALYQTYYILGETENAEAMEKILSGN